MKFLTNNKTDNHLTTLTDNLKLYDEAFFAVAFLKVSGLSKLIQTIKEFVKSGGQISIIAGQNFALTQPEALHTLRNLFLIYPTSKLYLAKANSATSVFHPKLYLFKSKNDCCIISGSANITEGGLTNNKETSLIADCNDNDTIWQEAKKTARAPLPSMQPALVPNGAYWARALCVCAGFRSSRWPHRSWRQLR